MVVDQPALFGDIGGGGGMAVGDNGGHFLCGRPGGGFAAEVERSREVRIDRTGRNGRMQRAYFDGRGSEKESI